MKFVKFDIQIVLKLKIESNVNEVTQKNTTNKKLFWNFQNSKKTFFVEIESADLVNPCDQLHDNKQTNLSQKKEN